MKKLGVILAILLAVTLVAGCASAPPRVQMDQLIVDLSLLPATRNAEPYARSWADFIINFEGVFPENVDWGYFNRFRLVLQFFDANGRPIEGDNDLVMMTLVYDLSKLEAPLGRGGDPGLNVGNAAQKQFNLMGSWSNVHTRGCMIMLTGAPGGLVLQNTSNPLVKFVEVKEIIFYNDEVVLTYED